MSAIDGTSSSSALPASLTGAGGPAPSAANLKDQFLKMFVAQLQNQDPLTPQDNSQFVAQLAQLSQLEQSSNTNDKLDEIVAAQASSSNASYATLVGRTATASASTLQLSPPGTPDLGVRLNSSAANVEVDVLDGSGAVVKKLQLGPHAAGVVDAGWDGTGAGGAVLPAGTYQIQVKATGAGGASVDAAPVVRGVIDAVEFSGGSTHFRIGSAVVAPADVDDVTI